MKFISKILVLITLLLSISTLTSCGGKKGDTTEQKGKEYTSAYVCPMHCEGSGSAQPGTCPVCGMDYVKNESMTHACPMHPEIIGMEGDKCSKCGMKLTAIDGNDHSKHNH